MFAKKILLLLSLFLFSSGLNFNLVAQDYSVQTYFNNGSIGTKFSENLPKKPKIGLVLSGGGSRGISHIGVIKVLDSLGIVPDLIVGTSIGGVVGGLYAAGYSPADIEKITHEINWGEIFTDDPQRTALFLGQKSEQDRYLLSLRLTNFKPYIPNAVTPGQKVLNILADHFLMAQYQVRNSFDDLRIPFRSVATDIVSGKMVVLKDGNIAEAINGSLAVPLLFSPVKRDTMLLVDGGVKSNLPVGVAQDLDMDIIIASDVSATLRTRDQINAPWEVADQVTTIMTDRNNLKEHKNVDILILPQIPKVTNTDFSKIDSMIQAGEIAACQKQTEIEEKIASWEKTREKYLAIKNIIVSDQKRSWTSKKTKNDSTEIRLFSIYQISDSLESWINNGEYSSILAEYDSTDQSFKFNFKSHAVIDSIKITGNANFSYSELIDSMNTKSGRRYNSRVLNRDIKRIIQLYRKSGYSLMEVEKVSFDEKKGTLSVTINEGIVLDIDVKGNKKTKKFLVLREFNLQKNDVFNWLNVKRGIENVYASALYNRVSVDVNRIGNQAKLVVRVEEKPSVRFQIGGKADIERRFQAYMELADENFLGYGVKGKLLTRLGVRDGLLGLTFRNDRIFTTFLTFTAQGYFTWESNPINKINPPDGRYREERLGLRLQLGQQLRRIGQLVGEVRIERVKDFKQEGTFLQEQEYELRTFALRSITDKRDRIDFPTQGVYNHWAWENGNSFLLNSQESYTKILVNLEGYYKLFEQHHVGHVRLLAGLGDETLPFSENFRIGGLNSFYGLLQNELFGKQVVLVNLEYRYKLPFKIFTDTYISARYDFASIWNKPNLVINSEDFFSGVGVNIGFDTFLGPLYLAWGKASLGRSNIYMSVGFDF